MGALRWVGAWFVQVLRTAMERRGKVRAGECLVRESESMEVFQGVYRVIV